MRTVKVIAIGIGNMGKVAVQCMLDHGAEIVAAVDTDASLEGKDVAEISDRKPIGIKIEKNLDEVLERVKADIAIVATQTAVDEIYEIVEKCVTHKLAVGTTSEEAFYPWQTAKESARKLDKLARENNVAVYASGIQDVFYLNLCQIMAGACNRISSVKCYNFLPLDDMGETVAEEMFLGRSEAEYQKFLEDSGGVNPLAEDTLTTAYAAAAGLGLHPVSDSMTCEPIIGQQPVYSRGIDRTIPEGTMIGIDSKAGVVTKEGVAIEIVFCYKVTEKESETPLIEWTITGEPSLRVVVDDIKGEVTTSATLVNRIPDILKAEPGFRTFMDMPKPAYCSGVMQYE